MLRGTQQHNVSRVNMQGRTQAASTRDDTVVAGRCNPRLLRWIRGVLPLVTWLAYLVVGAVIFEAVEEPEALRRKESQASKNKETNDTVVRLFEQLFAFTNGSMNKSEHDQILSELVEVLVKNANETNALVAHQEASWEFMGSAVFCMTVISTIGYGYLAPKTQLGRGLCMVYALIGIPLNIVVMAAAGNVLARGIRYLHCRLKHFLVKLTVWRRIGPPKEPTESPIGLSLTKRGTSNGGQDNRGFQLHVRRTDLSNQDSFRDQSQRPRPLGNDSKNNGSEHGNCRRLSQSSDDDAPSDAINDPHFPVYLLVILVLTYVVAFALLAWYGEMYGWSLLDAFYFIIITITTIGFGDLRVRTADDGSTLAYFMAIATPVVGMILLSAVISVAINMFGRKTRMIEDKICGKL